MFVPKTEALKRFAGLSPDKITELEGLFDGPTHVYIDFANVRKRLNWRIDFAKLKDLFDSFPHIKSDHRTRRCLKSKRGSFEPLSADHWDQD
jgi:hypothetical protein